AWKCARAKGIAAAAFIGMLAFAFHMLVDFHLKIPALAMTWAAVCAMVTQVSWPAPAASPGPDGQGRLPRTAALGVAAAMIVLTAQWIVPRCRAEDLRYAARGTIDRMARSGTDASTQGDALAAARGAFARAVALDPANAQAWSDRAY